MMTFNVRRDTRVDGAQRWTFRRDDVADLIQRWEPDVVGTQEATLPMLADLDPRLGGYERVGGAHEHWPGEEPNAIYYDPQRWRVVDAGIIWLSRTPLAPATRSWGDWACRNVMWALMVSCETRAPLLVANTHFDHMSPLSRVRSAQLVQRLMPHALLMGDFNAGPGTRVHATLLQGRSDPHLGQPGTHNRFREREGRRMDWILVPDHLSARGAEVVLDRREDGGWPSDHMPVVAHIEPPREPRLNVPDTTWTGERRVPTKLPPAPQDVAEAALTALPVAAATKST